MLPVSLQLHLVGSDDGDELCLFEEVAGMLAAEEDRTVALIIGDEEVAVVGLPVILLNRIRPDQVTNGPLERHLIKSLQFLQILQTFPSGCDASMDTEVILIDDADKGEGIEGIHDIEVDILVVLLNGLLVEVHDLRHLTRLVVAPQHDHPLGEFHL